MQSTLSSLEQAVHRAGQLRDRPGRAVLGIVGAPGAGKSVLAAALVDALGAQAALVPMDGFHLSNSQLERLGRRARKGAQDTFDAAGYVELLARLRRDVDRTVYAPRFHRDIEESYAADIAVEPHVRLVVTEGNYLMYDTGDWAAVQGLLDEVWYVDVSDDLRQRRLIDRHEQFGKSVESAQEWALGPDEQNAQLISSHKQRAEVLVRLAQVTHQRPTANPPTSSDPSGD